MNTNTDSIDDRANDEADRHSEMMRKQREGWDGKRPPAATNQPKVFRAICKTQWSTGNEK